MSMRRERGPLAAALASVGSFLVEPVEPPAGVASTPPPAAVARPVVTVFGLAPGCGSTVVARAVATALGARDPAGAATVTSEGRAALPPLGTGAATRLARLVAEFPGADARATGRLCVVRGVDPLALADGARYLAPVVLDAGSSLGGVHAALADHLLLVTTPRLEPALARVAAECLARVGPDPRIVVNRVAGRSAGRRGLDGARGRPGRCGREPRGCGFPARGAARRSTGAARPRASRGAGTGHRVAGGGARHVIARSSTRDRQGAPCTLAP